MSLAVRLTRASAGAVATLSFLLGLALLAQPASAATVTASGPADNQRYSSDAAFGDDAYCIDHFVLSDDSRVRATVSFTVSATCAKAAVELSLVAYGIRDLASTYTSQVIVDSVTGTFARGRSYTLDVRLPALTGAAAADPSANCPNPKNRRSTADNDFSGHGANTSGPYDSTCDGSPSANGSGKGKASGRPCAGCVGNADNKNPKGQLPGPQDANNGYECDGNSGIGKGNPAHTGCGGPTFAGYQVDFVGGQPLAQLDPTSRPPLLYGAQNRLLGYLAQL